MDDVTFSHNRPYVVYGETYGRGMSVIGRHRREGRSFSASRSLKTVRQINNESNKMEPGLYTKHEATHYDGAVISSDDS